ncbi:uncharacterized protein TNCV_2326371, partial [Trichonephila clavipes]
RAKLVANDDSSAFKIPSGGSPSLGKRSAPVCQMTGTLPLYLDSVVGGGTPNEVYFSTHMDQSFLCQGKGLVLPNLSIDETHSTCKIFVNFLANNAMSVQSPFTIHKALKGIGVESRNRLKDCDPVIYLLKPVLLRRQNSPTLPQTIKAGYLNCKIRPYIPNPLRCFKVPEVRTLQTACRGQLTCSRCASVGHSSADCSLARKMRQLLQPHSSDSKQCPKWKTEKEIQAIKTNRNISYLEARKLISPQLSQSYAQVAKPSTVTSTTQTDENITRIKCPPLQLLQPLLSVPQPDKSNSVSACLPLLELLPQSYPLPRPTPLFNHPLHLIYRIPRKSQKSERENEKKKY